MNEARKRRLKQAILVAIVALPPLVAAYAFWIEPYWIEVTRHETGEGPREITILHLTDLHFSRSEGPRERRILEVLAEEKPERVGAGSRFLPVALRDAHLRGADNAALRRVFMREARFVRMGRRGTFPSRGGG